MRIKFKNGSVIETVPNDHIRGNRSKYLWTFGYDIKEDIFKIGNLFDENFIPDYEIEKLMEEEIK